MNDNERVRVNELVEAARLHDQHALVPIAGSRRPKTGHGTGPETSLPHVDRIIDLQRLAGNAAVSAVLLRSTVGIGKAVGAVQRQKSGAGGTGGPRVKIPGVVVAGDALEAVTIIRINEAAPKVPAQWRRFIAYETYVNVGGPLAWRANNPGALRAAPTQIAKVAGATGFFAVFATMEDGRNAQRALYLNTYGTQTVKRAVATLTPPTENDTETYLRRLQDQGVDLNATVQSQIDLLMAAIHVNEGRTEGIMVVRPPKSFFDFSSLPD